MSKEKRSPLYELDGSKLDARQLVIWLCFVAAVVLIVAVTLLK
jgi:hypothetical protein